MEITESKAYKLCEKLNENGFKAELLNIFAYHYDKDYAYLVVHVEITKKMDLKKLWDLAGGFIIKLSRWANKQPEFVYELYSDWKFGEFVERKHIKYDRKMNGDCQKVYTSEEWDSYLKSIYSSEEWEIYINGRQV